MFKLTFLGTSSGTPTKMRGVSATAVLLPKNSAHKSANWVLVDCGDGTLRQILQTDLSLAKLSAIFISHLHGDHIFGLPALLSAMNFARPKQPLQIIAPRMLIKFLDTISLVSELYFDFQIDFIAIEDILNASHTVPYIHLTYQVVKLSHRIDSYGFRLSHNNTNIVICGDNDNPSLLDGVVQDCHLLVHEATYTKAVLDKVLTKFNPQHTCVQDIAMFAQNADISNLVLTHFSARFAPFFNKQSNTLNLAHIYQEARCYYKHNLFLASDSLTITVDKNQATKHLP